MLEVAGDALVVLRRERRACVESWYYWTEAGARRRTINGDAPGFGAAKNPFADHDAAEWEWDEWDLTLPNHAAATKRGAIRAFYDAYYAACAELEREFPANVRTYDCEALFESEAEQRDLFAWLGIRGDPPRERVCENQQRYLYLAPEGDDDAFVAGDFAERLDDDESATASSDDDDDEAGPPRRAGAAPDARMLAVVVPMARGRGRQFHARGVAIQATVPAGLAGTRSTCLRGPAGRIGTAAGSARRRRRRLQSRQTPRTRSVLEHHSGLVPPSPRGGALG